MRSSRGIFLCLALLALLPACGSPAQPPPSARESTAATLPNAATAPSLAGAATAHPLAGGGNAQPSPGSTLGRPLPGATDPGRLPPVVDHGPRTQQAVALTFDADMTPAMLAMLDSGRANSFANLTLLDILDYWQVPATFFVTGMWAERYPSVLQRIAAQPRYEIANHTYRHAAYKPGCYSLEQLPRTEMTVDARRTFDVLAPFGGNQTRYFRFPGLCHDSAALTALAPLGVTVIDGDVISGDPFATASAPIVRAVLDNVQPGSIIVLHVTEANAQYTDEALLPILEGLAERGLRPVKLSDLLSPGR